MEQLRSGIYPDSGSMYSVTAIYRQIGILKIHDISKYIDFNISVLKDEQTVTHNNALFSIIMQI
jgi:hypothetical protein